MNQLTCLKMHLLLLKKLASYFTCTFKPNNIVPSLFIKIKCFNPNELAYQGAKNKVCCGKVLCVASL